MRSSLRLAVLAGMLTASWVVAPVASAQAPNTASAFALSVSGTVNASSPTVTLPPGGTSDVVGVSVTGLSTGLLHAEADRVVQPDGDMFAIASANDVAATLTDPIGSSATTLTADQVAAECASAESQSPAGSSTIINGVLTFAGGPLVMPANPAPNTVFFNTATSPSTSVQVILNEQTLTPDGGLTVTAMHITELSFGIVTKDTIIAQTRCGVNTVPSPSPPVVTTDPATSVTSNSAALNATIDAGGSATTYKYEYGPTTAFGTVVPTAGTLNAGAAFGRCQSASAGDLGSVSRDDLLLPGVRQ